jgi:uroporphyrinogen decarboxylase
MVFDSWAGELGPASFKEFSEPYLAHIAQKLPQKLQELGLDKVPMTVFPKGAWYALDSACNLGYNVVGMDWLQDPAEAVRIRGDRNIVFQGNADPGVLYGSKAAITKAVEDMVKGFWVGNKGWIANLGHGMLSYDSVHVSCNLLTLLLLGITPGVNPDNLKFFFEEIHRLTKS